MAQTPVTWTWDGTHLNALGQDGALLFQADGTTRELLTVGLTGQELTITPAQLNLVVARINSLRSYWADALLTVGELAIGATAEKFKTTATAVYTIAGITYTYAATDNLVFSAANTINAAAAATAFWGAWIVEIGVDGLVHTEPAAFTSAADMSYTTEALAIAALPSPTASHVQLGYITAQNVASAKWDANTDNLTVGAGATNVTARSFYDIPAAKTLPAAIAEQAERWPHRCEVGMLTIVTPPTVEPITYDQAKDHLRVTTDDEFDIITNLITTARQYCETFTHRSLITQTWDLKFDGFPADDIWLPKPPLISVTSVTYTSTAGVVTTWAATNYTVDAPSGPECGPGRVIPNYGVSYPSTYGVPNCVTVRFVAGYGGASAVPAGIKTAMKLLVEHWWSKSPADASLLMTAVQTVLWPFKSW